MTLRAIALRFLVLIQTLDTPVGSWSNNFFGNNRRLQNVGIKLSSFSRNKHARCFQHRVPVATIDGNIVTRGKCVHFLLIEGLAVNGQIDNARTRRTSPVKSEPYTGYLWKAAGLSILRAAGYAVLQH